MVLPLDQSSRNLAYCRNKNIQYQGVRLITLVRHVSDLIITIIQSWGSVRVRSECATKIHAQMCKRWFKSFFSFVELVCINFACIVNSVCLVLHRNK